MPHPYPKFKVQNVWYAASCHERWRHPGLKGVGVPSCALRTMVLAKQTWILMLNNACCESGSNVTCRMQQSRESPILLMERSANIPRSHRKNLCIGFLTSSQSCFVLLSGCLTCLQAYWHQKSCYAQYVVESSHTHSSLEIKVPTHFDTLLNVARAQSAPHISAESVLGWPMKRAYLKTS